VGVVVDAPVFVEWSVPFALPLIVLKVAKKGGEELGVVGRVVDYNLPPLDTPDT
jgi:hypothetical protein